MLECACCTHIERTLTAHSLNPGVRMHVKNMRRPHQLVAVDGVGGAKVKMLEEDKVTNDGEKVQVTEFVDLLEDLPEEFTF